MKVRELLSSGLSRREEPLIPGLPRVSLEPLTGFGDITKATVEIASAAQRCGFDQVEIIGSKAEALEIIGGDGGFEHGSIKGGPGTSMRWFSITGPIVRLG